MVSKPLLLSGGLAILAAYTWQVFLHDFLFYAVGVGRQTSPIEAFPYDCRRLRHPLLESCEDLALDARGRRLFAACSDSLARGGWSPGYVSFFFFFFFSLEGFGVRENGEEWDREGSADCIKGQ